MSQTAALAAALVGFVSSSAAATGLETYRWERRLLLVIAAEAEAPALGEQGAILLDPGFAERDLDLIEVVGGAPVTINGEATPTLNADALRGRYNPSAVPFRALLIGKDGGVKRQADEPLSASEIFALIDTMPMRRQEMRRQDDG